MKNKKTESATMWVKAEERPYYSEINKWTSKQASKINKMYRIQTLNPVHAICLKKIFFINQMVDMVFSTGWLFDNVFNWIIAHESDVMSFILIIMFGLVWFCFVKCFFSLYSIFSPIHIHAHAHASTAMWHANAISVRIVHQTV